MSLLWKVIFCAHCPSTHHKLAMDALRHLCGAEAAAWKDLFLKHHAAYLDGAKAPDNQFRDFKNHVLHVRENNWGGAPAAACNWYRRTVTAFQEGAWQEGVYSAGVLSHYYTDPIQPFHTGQTEEEGKIHRAAEWSIAKSYEDLRDLLETSLGGYPRIEIPAGEDWLVEMVHRGARASNPCYAAVIDHYDLDRGVKRPKDGLDEEIKLRIAPLIGHAVVGFARILERAFQESAVSPPETFLALDTFLASLATPIAWVVQRLQDTRERSLIKAIYEEVQLTGKAVLTLPDDDWEVRSNHAREVLKIPRKLLDAQPAGPTGTKHGRRDAAQRQPERSKPTGASDPMMPLSAGRFGVFKAVPEATAASFPVSQSIPESRDVQTAGSRYHLELSSPVADAPAIGSKTAGRLEAIGIRNVEDLLTRNAQEAAAELRQSWITADTIRDWQAQASLVCRVPDLRGHDAQILVACGVRPPEHLATMRPEQLLGMVVPIADSSQGRRILRDSKRPDLEEVSQWIAAARRARILPAA